jgi:ethanolamine utilization protein EutQ (cupin superfamily)
MAHKIHAPSVIKAAGTREKIIKEYFGNVNSRSREISLAMMVSPQGWEEPGQTPDFDEYTLVLKGKLMVRTQENELIISEGEAVMTPKGEWVRYSTPFTGGAEYVAVCLPAFSPSTVHRDEE